MPVKLAFLNVKKSFKDYLIYIITVTIAFSLVFAFNFIAFSKDIQALSTVMVNFKYAIVFVSLIIIFVIGWLINYTMRFMFAKRSKEFGMYMLLGIEKKRYCQNVSFRKFTIRFICLYLFILYWYCFK